VHVSARIRARIEGSKKRNKSKIKIMKERGEEENARRGKEGIKREG
jgi:hypothetical protein